jgi:hypothetical protein
MQPKVPSPLPRGDKGLPAVLHPSGTHIVKMFVVPLLIVAGLLLGAYGFLRLTGGSVMRTPQSFLAELRSDNPDVRWRAAQDLAQILLRDEHLASDPEFCLQLSAELRDAVHQLDAAEQQAQDLGDTKELEARRTYVFYLTSCVGNLCTPVGAPILKQMAVDGGAGSARAQMTRRWRALWALANLGENLKRFEKLSPDRQQAVLVGFQEAASSDDDRATWAGVCVSYLTDRSNSLGVDGVLARCSADPNPFLREMAVFAMNFWDGPQIEDALVARLDDQGQGEELLAPFGEGDKNLDVQFTKSPGLRIRYNAAVALARHGSARTPIELFAEMLDESRQLDEHRLRSRKDGHETADEPTAHQTLETALRAIAELHRKNPRINLSSVDSAVEKLIHSADPGVRNEAERTRDALKN